MSTTEPVDNSAENEHESWDAFWAEQQRREAAEQGRPYTQTIRGVEVVVPHDLPLKFEQKLDQLKTSDEDGFKQLVGALFGADVIDAWVANGMGDREFEVVFAWGYANGKGKPMSFREAYEMVRSQEAEAGKAATRTRSNAASDGSGGRSRRTSSANTSSRRPKSQT